MSCVGRGLGGGGIHISNSLFGSDGAVTVVAPAGGDVAVVRVVSAGVCACGSDSATDSVGVLSPAEVSIDAVQEGVRGQRIDTGYEAVRGDRG